MGKILKNILVDKESGFLGKKVKDELGKKFYTKTKNKKKYSNNHWKKVYEDIKKTIQKAKKDSEESKKKNIDELKEEIENIRKKGIDTEFSVEEIEKELQKIIKNRILKIGVNDKKIKDFAKKEKSWNEYAENIEKNLKYLKYCFKNFSKFFEKNEEMNELFGLELDSKKFVKKYVLKEFKDDYFNFYAFLNTFSKDAFFDNVSKKFKQARINNLRGSEEKEKVMEKYESVAEKLNSKYLKKTEKLLFKGKKSVFENIKKILSVIKEYRDLYNYTNFIINDKKVEYNAYKKFLDRNIDDFEIPISLETEDYELDDERVNRVCNTLFKDFPKISRSKIRALVIKRAKYLISKVKEVFNETIDSENDKSDKNKMRLFKKLDEKPEIKEVVEKYRSSSKFNFSILYSISVEHVREYLEKEEKEFLYFNEEGRLGKVKDLDNLKNELDKNIEGLKEWISENDGITNEVLFKQHVLEMDEKMLEGLEEVESEEEKIKNYRNVLEEYGTMGIIKEEHTRIFGDEESRKLVDKGFEFKRMEQEHCPYCGEKISESDKTCPECDKPLITDLDRRTKKQKENNIRVFFLKATDVKYIRYCPYCGEEVGYTDKFCPNKECGKPLLTFNIHESSEAKNMIISVLKNMDLKDVDVKFIYASSNEKIVYKHENKELIINSPENIEEEDYKPLIKAEGIIKAVKEKSVKKNIIKNFIEWRKKQKEIKEDNDKLNEFKKNIEEMVLGEEEKKELIKKMEEVINAHNSMLELEEDE